MGKRVGVTVLSAAALAGLIGAFVACPAVGEAAMQGGAAKITLSLTHDYTPSPWTSEVGYANQAGQKLLFGVKNLLLGWTEIVTEPRNATQNGENFFVGLGKGLKNGIEDELGGAVHILTFPLPQIDAPLPEGGTDLLNSK